MTARLTHGSARRRARAALMTFALLVLVMPVVASAGIASQVEGETFVDSYDLGGVAISKTFCSAASEYYAADGIDVEGEWIELVISVPQTGDYAVRLAYQTAYEDSSGVRLTVLDDESPFHNTTTDLRLLEGWGFG